MCYNVFIDHTGVAVRMKTLISGGWAPPIECFIDHTGVAVRMKTLISGGWAPPIEQKNIFFGVHKLREVPYE